VIQVLHDMRWSPEWDIKKRNRHVIDLRACKDEPCILRSIGAVLKGAESVTIRGHSLDALHDVAGDWFMEHWGDKVEIYLRGIEEMRRCGPNLMSEISDVLNSAIDRAAVNAHLVGRDCAEDIAKERIKIFFCFS